MKSRQTDDYSSSAVPRRTHGHVAAYPEIDPTHWVISRGDTPKGQIPSKQIEGSSLLGIGKVPT